MSAWTAPRFACIASIEFLVSAWAAPMSACIAPIRSKSRSTAEPGRERRDEALDLFDTLEEQSRPPRGNKTKTRCVVPRAAPWIAATRKLRGTKDRGAAAWNAATCRSARHYGTRQHRELRPFGRTRGTIGERRHTSARHYRARQYESARHHRELETIGPHARHHGTRQHRELRRFGRTRGTMGERRHTSARHYRARQYESARHHRELETIGPHARHTSARHHG